MERNGFKQVDEKAIKRLLGGMKIEEIAHRGSEVSYRRKSRALGICKTYALYLWPG